MEKILIAGGGTFGHIAPALGVKSAFEDLGYEVTFVCAKRDRRFPFYSKTKNVKGLFLKGLPRNKNILKWSSFLFLLFIALIKTFFQMIKIKPKAVIVTGGFVSFPYLFWGKLFKKPFFICEQNSFPGLVNRMFASKAKAVFLSMKDESNTLRGNLILTGNPVFIKSYSGKEEALKALGLSDRIDLSSKILGVIGGSQGAEKINNWIFDSQKELEEQGFNTLISVGQKSYSDLILKKQSEKLHVFDFIEDMGAFYSVCDILICRAGASTIAELAYFSKPVIFIPYPYASNNHQYYNALYAQEILPALVVQEKEIENTDIISSLKKAEKAEKHEKSFSFNEISSQITKEVLKWI